MITLSKNQVIELLIQQSKQEKNTTKQKDLLLFIKFLKKSSIENFTTEYTEKHNINIGLLCENLVLKYLGLQSENLENEVKSYVVNTWNVLTNEKVSNVYIMICNNSSILKNGLYKIEGSKILNKRFTSLKEIKALKMEYVASLTKIIY
jgi:hypothetical protein